MTLYPTRAGIRASDYRERCKDTEIWKMVDDMANFRRAVIFPPGFLPFVAIGFLIVIPGAALFLFQFFSLFRDQSIENFGAFAFSSMVALVSIHGVLMFRVTHGYLFAQQDLVNYLKLLTLVLLVCTGFSIFFEADFIGTAAAAVGALCAWFMRAMAVGKGFTLCAEIFRTKLVYYKDRKSRETVALKSGQENGRVKK